jgi:hypothetical protein
MEWFSLCRVGTKGSTLAEKCRQSHYRPLTEAQVADPVAIAVRVPKTIRETRRRLPIAAAGESHGTRVVMHPSKVMRQTRLPFTTRPSIVPFNSMNHGAPSAPVVMSGVAPPAHNPPSSPQPSSSPALSAPSRADFDSWRDRSEGHDARPAHRPSFDLLTE